MYVEYLLKYLILSVKCELLFKEKYISEISLTVSAIRFVTMTK